MPDTICPTPGCCEPIKDHYRHCPNCGRILNPSTAPLPTRRVESSQDEFDDSAAPPREDDPFAGVIVGLLLFGIQFLFGFSIYTSKDIYFLAFILVVAFIMNIIVLAAAARNTSDHLRLLDFLGMFFLMMLIITSPIVYYNAGRYLARAFR